MLKKNRAGGRSENLQGERASSNVLLDRNRVYIKIWGGEGATACSPAPLSFRFRRPWKIHALCKCVIGWCILCCINGLPSSRLALFKEKLRTRDPSLKVIFFAMSMRKKFKSHLFCNVSAQKWIQIWISTDKKAVFWLIWIDFYALTQQKRWL